MGAALEALKGKQVDAVALAQPFPARAEADDGDGLRWGRATERGLAESGLEHSLHPGRAGDLLTLR
jgi:hypothetical protein